MESEIKYLISNDRVDDIKRVTDLLKLPDVDVFPVHFFDTHDLRLQKQPNKIILRLRIKKGKWQFTVKERPADPKTVFEGAEYELDDILDVRSELSRSLDAKKIKDEIAEDAIANHRIQNLLNDAQAAFLAGPLKGLELRCYPQISARKWELPHLEELAAEEWRYGSRRVLEFSIKANEENKGEVTGAFREFLTEKMKLKGLSAGMKTKTALESF